MGSNKVSGAINPDSRKIVPGDFVFCHEPEEWWWQFFTDKQKNDGRVWDRHIAMYVGRIDGIDVFLEAGLGPVHPTTYGILDWIWGEIDTYYVSNPEINDNHRAIALAYSSCMILRLYQWTDHTFYNHWNPVEWIPKSGKDYDTWWNVFWECRPKFQCAELVWAGYMSLPEPNKVNIAKNSERVYGWGSSCWDNVGANQLKNDDDTSLFINTKNFIKIYSLPGSGTVDPTIENDDPENNTWTTIQKAVDNLSTSDTLLIKNGDYYENISINKSINIIGENINNVVIHGSINMSISLDYELPDYGKNSMLKNVNMTGNGLLMHFNNDSSVGENYSSSNTIFDYSGQEKNGTNYNSSWITPSLKGNGSLGLNGVNSYVKLGDISALSGENVTVSAWINWQNGSGAFDPIISQSNTTHGYCLYINTTTNKPVFRLDDTEVISTTNISNGWHQIVGTHNETKLKIFIDGTQCGSVNKTGSGSNFDCYIGFDNISQYFNGTTDGNDYTFATESSAGWSRWFDITNDGLRLSYPSAWTWAEVRDLDCDVEAENLFGFWTLYCSKVEVRVTYNNVPGISSPYPIDGSKGITLTPTLNITVSDPNGDLMNLTWLSNSSGSWQVFGANSSISNGTYYQVFSNASENGQWWFWKVNVSDEDGYNISNVYKFYTGVQSKIVNTGSADISGYLLIQVHYYNASISNWTVADDTINETSMRTLAGTGGYGNNSSSVLGLDTLFNGLVNTSNLLDSFGNGTYRVYVAFRDPDGDVMVCDDESLLEATYNFTITTS
jgi:hypothetical protein